METHVKRKISAVLLAALFLGWGAVLAYAENTPLRHAEVAE